jgi:hypothetical protein
MPYPEMAIHLTAESIRIQALLDSLEKIIR